MRLTQAFFSQVGKWSKQFSNLPDRYIKRVMEQVYWRNPKGKEYLKNAVVKRKKYFFGIHRPWTMEFYQYNLPGTLKPKVFVEPIKNWSVFRGDRVEVLVGKDKGKQGIVKYVVQERNWVIVEGLNTKLKKVDFGKNDKVSDMYVLEEQPLRVTDQVSLVDPSELKPTRIEWRYTESGQHVRVSLRTGRIIPLPHSIEETYDYKTKSTYKDKPKDTAKEEVEKITFKPQLKTFEMDIMENMGIKEDRVPSKSYWY